MTNIIAFPVRHDVQIRIPPEGWVVDMESLPPIPTVFNEDLAGYAALLAEGHVVHPSHFENDLAEIIEDPDEAEKILVNLCRGVVVSGTSLHCLTVENRTVLASR